MTAAHFAGARAFQRRVTRGDAGPTYRTLADGRRQVSLRLDASGFDPRDVRVLVDRDQLLVDAERSESRASADVISGRRSDVTRARRLSRRYLLPGCARAGDVRCLMTSDGMLSVECTVRAPTSDGHVTPTGGDGGKTWRSSKQVQFDLS